MAASSSNFPATLKIIDDQGRMTSEFRRWLDDALNQRNPMVIQPATAGALFTGDLAGKTVTVIDGVITQVV